MSLIGRQLGDFLLDKKLGAGGMGEVYRAKQISLDRTVAVKILPKSLASQEGFEERFKREARAAANLIHPNVIQVYHIGIDPDVGSPYFAMEFVEGEDLQQRMKRLGHLQFDMIVEIMAGVAAALSVAYEKGIIHRDIKPSNIMIDKNEIVKVMDFGLAKATQDSQSSNLTQSGLIMGTPNYISPEAGKGDPVDSRSDIYSLGVALYELLTGRLPFTASTPAAIIYKHVYEAPPPPRSITADIPPFLEEICLRMIAKEPKDRYPNPKALLADLNEFKRNTEHYMKGGARRAPAIGSGSVAGDATMTASGSYPGRPGFGSKTADQTQNFQAADTKAETGMLTRPNTPATPTPVPVTAPKGFLTPVNVGVVVAALAIGIFGATRLFGSKPAPQGLVGASSGGSGEQPKIALVAHSGKAILPLTRLSKALPKSVKLGIMEGIEEHSIDRDDFELDPGQYKVVFHRPGYETVKQIFQLASDGTVTPPLESVKFDWAPLEEFKRNVDVANQCIKDKKYRDAINLVQGLVEKAPDYADAVAALAKAKEGQAELTGLFARANAAYRDHRWEEAKKVMMTIPDTFDDYPSVAGMMATCDTNLSQLKIFRTSFETQVSDGKYGDARETLTEIDRLVPAQDPDQKKARDRVADAQRLYDLAEQEIGNGDFAKALEALEPLLKVSPNYAKASQMASKARAEMDKRLSASQQLDSALAAGEKAYAGGQFDGALAEAMRALAIDSTSKPAADLRDRAQARVGESEISRRFAQLDEAFRTLSFGSKDKRVYALNELTDAGSPARAALDADVPLFSLSPIEVKEAAHSNFAVKITGNPGSETATVESDWNVKLGFPECDGAQPPARGRDTAMTIHQRATLRRAGSNWMFTNFEEIGKANVQ